MKGLSLVPCLLALAAVSPVLADPPAITNQPQDILVNKYSAAQFSVGASGAVSYQWSLNNATVDGATNATFSLDDVTDPATVSVTVFNGDGQTTSRTASLSLTSGTLLNLTISGYPDGSSSNVVIALFDHDKPVTVENFLRYITSGAYSNMFFERLVVDPADNLSILQGGDDDATPPTSGVATSPTFTPVTKTLVALTNAPPLIINEFSHGPVIHNRYGTLAMAKQATIVGSILSSNTAENGFFFNLADNSTNLDNQNGGFTVFGRVIEGTNALNYFLGLSKNGHGIFDGTPYPPYPPQFTDLPVNYQSFAFPVDSNLFYGTFSPVSSYPAFDANLPSVSLTTINTNSRNLHIDGTASDDVGVAAVLATIVNPIHSFSPIVIGTTNWTIDPGVLPAGSYQLQMDAVNGNWLRASSAPTAIRSGEAIATNFTVPYFPLDITVEGTGTGFVTVTWTNNGAPQSATAPTTLSAATMASGSNFVLHATPALRNVFAGWNINSNQTVLSPILAYDPVQNGGTISASFTVNNLTGGITMTSPKAAQQLTNGVVDLAGKLKANLASPTVTCQILDGKGRSAYVGTGSSASGIICAGPLPAGVAVGSYVTITGCDRKALNGTFQLTYVSAADNIIIWGNGNPTSTFKDATAVINFNTTETQPFGATINGNTWSATSPVNLAPGSYTAQATVTDATGRAATVAQNFAVLAPLTIEIEGPGKVSSKSRYVAIGHNYSLTAAPLAGDTFYNWFNGAYGEIGRPGVTFPVEGATTWQASFIGHSLPAGFGITSPAKNGTVNTTNFIISGTLPALPDGDAIARVTCEVFTNGLQGLYPNGNPLFVVATNLTDTTWSAQLQDVPLGTVTIAAVAYDTQGNSKLVSENINVNAFGTAAGTYNGVFFANAKSPGPILSSGMLHLTVTTTGVASGTLRFAGLAQAYPVHARFNVNGYAEVSPGGFNGRAVGLAMNLPIGDSNQPMVCTVGQVGWTTEFVADLAATSLSTNQPSIGNYILNFTPQNINAGIGYAFVTVSNNGGLSVVGTLPDGVSFTEGTALSDDGYWPLFLISTAYQNKGELVSSEQISNINQITPNAGTIWVKNKVTGPAAAYYPSLSTNGLLTTTGGLYAPPTNGQYNIVFYNGALPQRVTNTLSYVDGQFTPSGNVTSISISPNGFITGNFANPNSNPADTESFQGAFINPSEGGGGFMLEPQDGVTAAFVVTPSP